MIKEQEDDFKINKNISDYVFGNDSIYFLPKLLEKTSIKWCCYFNHR